MLINQLAMGTKLLLPAFHIENILLQLLYLKTVTEQLSFFFAAQVHWTVAMSQMIQDDSQLTFGRDPTGNWRKWKNEERSFLERKHKVWLYIKLMYMILKYWT